MRNLHLHLTDGEQLVEGFCYNINQFDVLRSEFSVAPFFKIFCYLAERAEIMNFNNRSDPTNSSMSDFLFFVQKKKSTIHNKIVKYLWNPERVFRCIFT